MSTSMTESATLAANSLSDSSSLVGQPAAALLKMSARNRKNNQNQAVAKDAEKTANTCLQ